MRNWILNNITYQGNALKTMEDALSKYQSFLRGGETAAIKFYIRECSNVIFRHNPDVQEHYATPSHLLRAFVSYCGGKMRYEQLLQKQTKGELKWI